MNYATLNEFADEVAQQLGWKRRPKFYMTPTNRGKAFTAKGYFTLPLWLLERHEAFQRQYLIHELCHFVAKPDGTWGCRHHGAEMRQLETAISRHFGMAIEYRGEAYLSTVRDLSGNTLCVAGGCEDGKTYTRQGLQIDIDLIV